MVDPPAERSCRHREGGRGRLAGPDAPRLNALPWKEGHERAGSARLVAVVQVVRARVVEVDGLLHESQAEAANIEVDVLLRVSGDGGDVVQTLRGGGHDGGPSLRPR